MGELFSLMDLLGLADIGKLFNLHRYAKKRDDVEVPEWVHSRLVFKNISAVLRIAFWVATMERHILVEPPPRL